MRHIDKRFLSESIGETGAMVCTIETPLAKDISDWTIREGGHISGSIQVRDCNGRPVHLDFDSTGQKTFEKRIAKLDLMVDMLTRMRKQYEEMWYSHQRDLKWKEQQAKKGDKK